MQLHPKFFILLRKLNFASLGVLLLTAPAFAVNYEVAPGFTYQGRLFETDGVTPYTGTINVTSSIYDPTGTCLLYQETQNTVDLSASNGLFAISIGSATADGKRTGIDPGLSMAQVFANTGSVLRANPSAHCAGGYTPGTDDTRILRLTITENTGGATDTLPDQTLSSVPQAQVAQTLQGLYPADLLQVSTPVTQANVQALVNNDDISSLNLHNHDATYVKISSGGSPSSLGSGGVYTSGQLGIGMGAPAAGIQMQVLPGASTTVGELISAHAGQTADLLQVRDSSGNNIFEVNSNGSIVTANSTVATVGANANSNSITLGGNYYTGAASAADTWTIQDVLGSGANPTSTLTFTHSGSSGGTVTSLPGTLRLNGSTSGYVAFAPPAAAGSTTYTLPSADGTGGYVLTTNGTGTLSWQSAGLSGTVGIGNGGTGLTTTPTNGQLLIGNGTNYTLSTLTGTANEVNVSNAAGSITLSTPQNIGTASSVQFGKQGLGTSTFGTNSILEVNPANTADNAATAQVSTAAVGNKGLVVQGSAGQTANLQEWQNNAGTTLSSIDMSGAYTNSTAGSVSHSAIKVGGSPYSAGSATTNKPQVLVEDAATSTGWSTSGTYVGVNAATGFTGNLIDAQLNGVSKFSVSSAGVISGNGSGLTNVTAASVSGTVGVGNGGTGVTGTPTNGQLAIGNGTNYTLSTLTGTANEVNVSNAAGSITLSTPQNIGTASSVQFGKQGLGTSTFGTNSILEVNPANTADNAATAQVSASSATNKGIVVQGYTGQTANLEEWQSSTGTVLAEIKSTGEFLNPTNGTASTPAMALTGSPYTGGTATTNKPELLLEDSGNTSTGWSTNGTYVGVNAAAGFTGNLFDAQLNGTSKFKVSSSGAVTATSFSGDGSALTNVPASSVTGTVGVANGGTGLTGTPTNGQLPIGNGTNYTLATLTGTANQVSVSNAAGSITLSTPQNIGTASSVQFGKEGIGTSTFGTHSVVEVNPYNTVDNAATAQISTTAATYKGLVVQGFAAQSANLQEWQNSAGTVLSYVDSSGIFNGAVSASSLPVATNGALGGLEATTGVLTLNGSGAITNIVANSAATCTTATSANGLQGMAVSSTVPTVTGQVLTYNGTNWAPVAGGTVTTVSASSPLSITSTASTTPNVTFSTQSANTVLAGPTSGGAVAPTFRALASSDLPATTAYGPGSSTSGDIATFNGTGGVTLQDSGIKIDASQNVTMNGALTTNNANTATAGTGNITANYGQIRIGSTVSNTAGTTINWNNGNVQTSADVCGTNAIAMTNMNDGGSYTLVLNSGTVATGGCAISATNTAMGAITFKYSPTLAQPTSTPVIFTFIVVGTTAYGAWIAGFN